MPTKYCPHCQASEKMRVGMHRREKTAADNDTIMTETKSLHCEVCNLFVDSKDTIVNGVRHSKIDRRSKPGSANGDHAYKGRERRSGIERRIWVDKLSEIQSKI